MHAPDPILAPVGAERLRRVEHEQCPGQAQVGAHRDAAIGSHVQARGVGRERQSVGARAGGATTGRGRAGGLGPVPPARLLREMQPLVVRKSCWYDAIAMCGLLGA